MATLKYWLWLSTRKGLRPEQIGKLLEHFGAPERAYYADPEEYGLVEGLTPAARTDLLDKSLEGTDAILGECDRLGVRILTLGDADYPDRLKNIYDPPAVLYVKGRLPAFDEEIAVAVVGSRKPSAYGRWMAGKLGLELAEHGALVVSGIAQGLDTEALKGALRGGGAVVSVLGCGVDVCYPRENRWLYADVAASGALISEYPPGTEPEGWHFPIRNRIISGLSLGVVAVECGLKSGTMSTVKQALDQDRDVFAVPGCVGALLSEGPNRLIQQGAKLVTSGLDIVREYAGLYPERVRFPDSARAMEEAPKAPEGYSDTPESPSREEEPREKVIDKGLQQAYIDRSGLTDDQIDLILALEDGKRTAEELVDLTQIPARRILSALTMLQIQGHVVEHPGRRFESTVRLRTGEEA